MREEKHLGTSARISAKTCRAAEARRSSLWMRKSSRITGQGASSVYVTFDRSQTKGEIKLVARAVAQS